VVHGCFCIFEIGTGTARFSETFFTCPAAAKISLLHEGGNSLNEENCIADFSHKKNWAAANMFRAWQS
jgi:hypothetical protein